MDLNQRKLNKSEWESIEIPVSEEEIRVLKLISSGFNNVNIRINNHYSLLSYLKIEYNTKMEDYLYNRYFSEKINKILKKYEITDIIVDSDSKVQIKSADKIRLEKNDDKQLSSQDIYEFVLIGHMEKIFKYESYMKSCGEIKDFDKKKLAVYEKYKSGFLLHYYTLYKLIQNNVLKINRHIESIVNMIVRKYSEQSNLMYDLIENAVGLIEKNDVLLKYNDLTLYNHQKEIFTICKNNTLPKLILYMAPTGTGKTLTPIALSEKYKIIFVCAARHVGLALARAAISVNKKVAFAFGCSSAADIRLHYFAAKVFTKNKRTGGIGKVDNSVGDDVEIMICDIKSYLPAMFYMKAFNPADNLLLYWDEPTITLDYEEHEFHSIIKQNWTNNLIPNVVLSSATLPKMNELTETISDFKSKFSNSQIHNIQSHDCKKSIPIINKDGFVVLPHYLYEKQDDIVKVATHCENNLTLLRYFDLNEVIQFITFCTKNNFVKIKAKLSRYFETIQDITMSNIKIYYLTLLQNIIEGTWGSVYIHFKSSRKPKLTNNHTIDEKGNKLTKSTSMGPGVTFQTENLLSGSQLKRLASEQVITNKSTSNSATGGMNATSNCIYVTTKDAYTLTDGPTIFITNQIEKIAKFYIQQSNIPVKVMEDLLGKIEYNNLLNNKLNELEKKIELLEEKAEKSNEVNNNGENKGSTMKDCKKMNRDMNNDNSEIRLIMNEISNIRSLIKNATLNEMFVPNKQLHLKKWADELETSSAFTSNIEETTVNEIMLLHGIEDSWKILLMMGIGVFTSHNNIAYTEIMKKLADQQKLYMIIASSDYIYGTNYQFCHAYISKDLNLTQEKIIQAMGRIGRNNIQQNYTVRFRDDDLIKKLFTEDTEKPEIRNMNILFTSA